MKILSGYSALFVFSTASGRCPQKLHCSRLRSPIAVGIRLLRQALCSGSNPPRGKQKKHLLMRMLFCWRRERDSNPRLGLTNTHFPGVRLRPAQPSLHKNIQLYFEHLKYSNRKQTKCQAFFLFFLKKFQWSGGRTARLLKFILQSVLFFVMKSEDLM